MTDESTVGTPTSVADYIVPSPSAAYPPIDYVVPSLSAADTPIDSDAAGPFSNR